MRSLILSSLIKHGAEGPNTSGDCIATAANEVANNRQLHPSERQTASNLAGGKYSAQQIEDALRTAGDTKLGESAA